MKFEWDINKAELNIKNHGVSFDKAIEAFSTRTRFTALMRNIPKMKKGSI